MEHCSILNTVPPFLRPLKLLPFVLYKKNSHSSNEECLLELLYMKSCSSVSEFCSLYDEFSFKFYIIIGPFQRHFKEAITYVICVLKFPVKIKIHPHLTPSGSNSKPRQLRNVLQSQTYLYIQQCRYPPQLLFPSVDCKEVIRRKNKHRCSNEM
jgi:hypothetical protein